MSAKLPAPRIGIYGTDETDHRGSRGCYLWPMGYAAAITAAGGTPASLELPNEDQDWDEVLASLEGVVFLGNQPVADRQAGEEERFCNWCQERGIPFLGIDRGLHVLTTAFGGSLHLDLALELPQALQHRHPPEKGLRHAIMVERGTHLANLYGEGEIVVNSEHRRGVARVARGFRVSARALDGVIEAVEFESDDWFAVGVQWLPAAASASGLDIQLFRGLVDKCLQRQEELVSAA